MLAFTFHTSNRLTTCQAGTETRADNTNLKSHSLPQTSTYAPPREEYEWPRIAPCRPLSRRFLNFRPRVQFRAPHWVFLDIASTSHFFKGEEGLMHSAMNLARDLGFGVQCAIADTPAGAQAFTVSHQEFILPARGGERRAERSLPPPPPSSRRFVALEEADAD